MLIRISSWLACWRYKIMRETDSGSVVQRVATSSSAKERSLVGLIRNKIERPCVSRRPLLRALCSVVSTFIRSENGDRGIELAVLWPLYTCRPTFRCWQRKCPGDDWLSNKSSHGISGVFALIRSGTSSWRKTSWMAEGINVSKSSRPRTWTASLVPPRFAWFLFSEGCMCWDAASRARRNRSLNSVVISVACSLVPEPSGKSRRKRYAASVRIICSWANCSIYMYFLHT